MKGQRRGASQVYIGWRGSAKNSVSPREQDRLASFDPRDTSENFCPVGLKVLSEQRLGGEVQSENFLRKSRSPSHPGSAQPTCLHRSLGPLGPIYSGLGEGRKELHNHCTLRPSEAQAPPEQPHLHQVVELHLPLSKYVAFKVLHLTPLRGLHHLPCVQLCSGGGLLLSQPPRPALSPCPCPCPTHPSVGKQAP